MKLPKYEGNEVAEATAQFAALQKEAEALVAASQSRIAEIQVGWLVRGSGFRVGRGGGRACARMASEVPPTTG